MFQGGFPAAERPNLPRKRARQRGNCPDYIMESPKNRGKGELAPPNHGNFAASPAVKFREL